VAGRTVIGIIAEEGSAVFTWDLTRAAIEASGAEIVHFVERPQSGFARRKRDLPARAAMRLLLRTESRLAGFRQSWFDPPAATPLACTFKGHFKDFPAAEVAKISEARVDLLIRLGGRGIYRGGILEAARHGMVSIHHGDNRIFRGGPPGFWEILQGSPRSGFIVQRLTAKLDGGAVLVRGNQATARYWALNRKHLFDAADLALSGVVRHFVEKGGLPEPEPPVASFGPIYRMPGLGALARYFAKVWVLRRRPPGSA
jgi:methionyl-tRNA formyltransferase